MIEKVLATQQLAMNVLGALLKGEPILEERVFYIVDPVTLEDTKVIAFEDITKGLLIRFRDGGEVQLYKGSSIVLVTEDCDGETFKCEAFRAEK
jgi:hypothetical protein